MKSTALPIVLLAAVAAATARPPNIVLFLTDDQDQMLGGSFPPTDPAGATPMPKTKALLADKGATATNFFVHTPICCPSRNELLAGRYLHNIKMLPDAVPKPPKGGACMHVNESKTINHTFARYLEEGMGYAVGMFGKFVNNVPDAWGVAPQGFDAWMANGGGNYLSPTFGVKNLKAFSGIEDGNDVVFHGNYTTAVVGNISSAWIRHVHRTRPSTPFFAYVAPKAAHEPFDPAPWYADHWEASWPQHEPRPIDVWNATAAARADHHGNIATQPMLTSEAAEVITGVFRNRWRCLMSVDDVIEGVLATVAQIGQLDTTYFFFTSDHGFQLGEYNMLMDKRHVYDFDTRVHLLVRGPHIAPGSVWSQPATFVDLAPTFLELGGVQIPPHFDGKSLLPLLRGGGGGGAARGRGGGGDADGEAAEAAAQAEEEAARAAAYAAYAASWRTDVLLEYYFVDPNVKCVANCTMAEVGDFPRTDEYCVDLSANRGCWGGKWCNQECYATESRENNWRALRDFSSGANLLYAEFQTGDQAKADLIFDAPDFYEYYNMSADPWSLHNLHSSTPTPQLDAMRKRLQRWYECAGSSCP